MSGIQQIQTTVAPAAARSVVTGSAPMACVSASVGICVLAAGGLDLWMRRTRSSKPLSSLSFTGNHPNGHGTKTWEGDSKEGTRH